MGCWWRRHRGWGRALNVLVMLTLLLPGDFAALGAGTAQAHAVAPRDAAPAAGATEPSSAPASAAQAPATTAASPAPVSSLSPTSPPAPAGVPLKALAAPRPPAPIERAAVGPAGGELRSLDGKVVVRFPAGATAEHLSITYQSLPKQVLASQRMVWHFALNAYALDRQDAPVHRFERPLEITVHYSDDEVRGLNAAALAFSYRDESSGQWIGIPSAVDVVARTVTARLDHFSGISIGTDPNISGPGLIQHFQNDLHSGAATADYPIEVPAGPGGFQPKLVLTYNSARVDEMKSAKATGSWTGLGWSLDLGRVSYDDASQRRYLQLNGEGYELWQNSADNDSRRWHTKSESYYLILFENNVWKVWDKAGTYYEFGGTSDSQQFYWNYNGAWNAVYYRWDLNVMRDTHSNRILVEYYQDQVDDCSASPCHQYVRAAYPKDVYYGTTSVGYPKGRANVHFDMQGSYNASATGGTFGKIILAAPRGSWRRAT